MKMNYGEAILAGFDYLLSKYPEVFVIGQGLWSPWYVGNTMTGLDKKFGADRIIDTPVSESACTGAAVGAALAGMKPIVVHPRMDFMLYAMDAIVNQAAKWRYMTGGQTSPSVTIRGIINRGGEQGAQHSQALHAWFAHVPGLRVVMPATVQDARDLFIASVLCPDPVVFIDDRWLYQETAIVETAVPMLSLSEVKPQVIQPGEELTLVASGHCTQLAGSVSARFREEGFSVEVIDVRVLNPFDPAVIIESVTKTKRLVVLDGGWAPCGFAGEVLASVLENINFSLEARPKRMTLPFTPAPTATAMEQEYYLSEESIYREIRALL